MDPVTLLICVAAIGWIVRALAEDVISAWRGVPSPRIARHVTRQRLALERIAAGGSPPLTLVFSQRLADRIANPPERRWLNAAREYLDVVIADGFEDARYRHAKKRCERAAKYTPPDGRGPESSEPAGDDDIVDAEVIPDYQPPPATEPEPPPPSASADTPSPAPDPVPEPPSKDTSPMTNASNSQNGSTVINGDVGSPEQAVAYHEATLAFNDAVAAQVDIALSNLRGAEVGEGFLAIIETGLDGCHQFKTTVEGARVEYADHVLAKADLSSNPDLVNTLLGYLSTARS